MVKFKIGGIEWMYDVVPNTCPLCHYAIDPRYLTGVIRKYEPMGQGIAELVFQCPQDECHHVFIGRYEGHYERTVADHRLTLRATTPVNVEFPDQPAEVATLSPQFVAIYGEAAAAEARGLKQVAGCGYRKALEFLVKDFCIAQNASEAEAIKAQFLGKVIDERINDPQIKAMAKRATWLGNDESHYVRIWDDKGMTDLKKLITLTVSWINTYLLTKKYEKEMPDD